MEELDIEILNDMQEQMDQCTRLAIKYTSLLTSNSVDIPAYSGAYPFTFR